MRSIISDLFSVATSNLAIILFGLGKAIIIARVLGPEQNGIISALLVYPSLFMTIGALGIRKSAGFYIGKKVFNEREIVVAILQIWFFNSFICTATSFALLYYFSNSSDSLSLIFFAVSPVSFSLLSTYLSGIYLGRNEIQEFNRLNWVPVFLIFISTFILVYWLNYSIKGVLVAELIGPLVMAVMLSTKLSLWKYLSRHFNIKLLKSLFKMGLGFAISLAVINMNYRIDVILMDLLCSKYELGIYSKGAVITQYLWQVPMLLGTIVFARGTRAKDRLAFSRKVAKLLRISLIIVGVCSVGLIALAKFIILVLFGESFLTSSIVMMWLLPGVILLTIFKVLNMDMGSKGKPFFALKSMVPALVVNVIMNYLLIPQYGAIGAALSSTISYTVGSVVFLFTYIRESGLSLIEIFHFRISDFDFLNPYLKRFGLQF